MAKTNQRPPSGFAVDPALFGRKQIIDWSPPPLVEDKDAFRSAVVQHVWAYRVRAQMLEHGHNQAAAARAMFLDRTRLRRLLTGQLPILHDELLKWETYTGQDDNLGTGDERVDRNLRKRATPPQTNSHGPTDQPWGHELQFDDDLPGGQSPSAGL